MSTGIGETQREIIEWVGVMQPVTNHDLARVMQRSERQIRRATANLRDRKMLYDTPAGRGAQYWWLSKEDCLRYLAEGGRPADHDSFACALAEMRAGWPRITTFSGSRIKSA